MNKYLIVFVSIIFVTACTEKPKQMQEERTLQQTAFYVGSYTDQKSEGIYKYYLQEHGKLKKAKLVARSESPSFLAFSADQKRLLAVNETDKAEGQGTVEVYTIGTDTLLFQKRVQSAGAHPCHITTNEQDYVLVSNYSSGTVALSKLLKNNNLELKDINRHEGNGTTDRQESAHAHSSWFSPYDSSIISADLGTNELWITSILKSTEKLDSTKNTIAMADGAGPRHVAFHPKLEIIYVINELNSTVTSLARNKDGNYRILQSISTLPVDYKENNQCADIHISSDGLFLYASNRGHNSIAIFSIDTSGSLTSVGFEPTKGEWPRNFAISPDQMYLVVANQFSNNLVSFERNPATGKLTFVDKIEAFSPTCVVF